MVVILYQKLLLGQNPYFISIGGDEPFQIHRHPEIELTYCISGPYSIACEEKTYTLQTGDLIVVGPMSSHEILQPPQCARCVIIELGYGLLKEHFEHFKNQNSNCIYFEQAKHESSKTYRQLVLLLEETTVLYETKPDFHELAIKGNLYKISALLLQLLNDSQPFRTKAKKITDIDKIETALEKIHNQYYEPLTVEYISDYCGYSKSNFCKIFKAVTGETFHNTLNRHRVEIACTLLCETNYTIEKIAQETGFSDTKSFCRVFKTFIGQSAGEYRKEKSSN